MLPEKAELVLWNAALPVRKTVVFLGRVGLAGKRDLISMEEDASFARREMEGTDPLHRCS